MKKRTHIYPNIFLLIMGRIFLLMPGIALIPVIQYFEVNILCILTIAFIIFANIFLFYIFGPHIWGEIIITEKSITYFGLFLPFVRIKLEDIRYVDIRTFDKGNAVYVKGVRTMGVIDAHKYLLISEKPLPRKRIDKIRSSRKRRIIKFAVNKKLCEALKDKLPEKCKGPVEYQLFLYWKAKR